MAPSTSRNVGSENIKLISKSEDSRNQRQHPTHAGKGVWPELAVLTLHPRHWVPLHRCRASAMEQATYDAIGSCTARSPPARPVYAGTHACMGFQAVHAYTWVMHNQREATLPLGTSHVIMYLCMRSSARNQASHSCMHGCVCVCVSVRMHRRIVHTCAARTKQLTKPPKHHRACRCSSRPPHRLSCPSQAGARASSSPTS